MNTSPLLLLRRYLPLIFSLVVLIFLGTVLYRQGVALWEYARHLRPGYFLLALLLGVGTSLYEVAIWRLNLGQMGVHIPYRQAVRVWYFSAATKYVPGTVWQVFGWFYMCDRVGIGRVPAMVTVVLVQIFSVLAGLIVVGISLARLLTSDVVLTFLILGGGMAATLLALHPVIGERIVNWGLARIGREPVRFGLRVPQILLLLVLWLVDTVLWGVAFFVLMQAVLPVPLEMLPGLVGVFPAGYVLGLVTLIAPSGIGVREGTLLYLLSFFIPAAAATVIALLSRLWTVLVDLTGLTLAFLAGGPPPGMEGK